MTNNNNKATRFVASTLGVLVGVAGIDHGIFEILQGNRAPDSLMIAAIGPEQRFWEYGLETALTIVPHFLVTGILAVLVGILVMLWSIAYIETKYGALVLMVLCIILFLVGGGFAPIFMAILASLTATRINKPLVSIRRFIPDRVLRFLGKFWLWILIAFVIVFVISVEIAIFGWPLTSFFDAETANSYLYTISYAMLGLMILAILTALAHDAHLKTREESIPRE